MTLNIGRARMQQAAAVAQGISFALSRGPLPSEYFEALATSGADTEAKEMEFASNAEREWQAARAKHGFTG